MKISKLNISTYGGSSGLKDVNIINSYEIDFLGVFIAILLGIIAWELVNKKIYVPPNVWSVVIILLILGIIFLVVIIVLILVSLVVALKLLRGD